MFTQLPPEIFKMQREFISAMSGKLDFEWTALTLVTEETKELREVYEEKTLSDENIHQIFKETADVIYVVAHFYNTMPVYAPELISKERNQKIQNILDDASDIVSTVSQKLHIPLPLIIEAYVRVHKSNMSKLDDKGNPVRREDGKIMKGPNYAPPDLTDIVEAWKELQAAESNAIQKGVPIQ